MFFKIYQRWTESFLLFSPPVVSIKVYQKFTEFDLKPILISEC